MNLSTTELLQRPVLIAGFGSIGRRHFRNLQQLGCRQFVFYRSRKGTIADDETTAWPATTDLDEALSHRPGIVVISNPSSLHIPVALAAAEAGCHLFIEKPISATLDGCDQLAAIVRDKRLTAMIGCHLRFHPLLIRLRDQVNAGRIGQVLGADSEWGDYLPGWHPWEDYRKSYAAQSGLGGGIMLTLIHPFDYLYWMFGPIARVQAATRAVPSLATEAAEDWADVTLEFASGFIGHIHLDYVQRPPVHRLHVWGDDGRATWDYHAGTLRWESTEGQFTEEKVPDGFERNTMYIDEMRHFLAAAADRQPSQIPLEDGVAVLDVVLKAKQNAKAAHPHA